MTILSAQTQIAERWLRSRKGRARFERFMSSARDTVLPSILDRLDLWRERARTRRRLLTLDDRLLRDIGISRAEAWQEASKPFWK